MTLRVSRSLLEAALLNMMNEEDLPVAPDGTATASNPPPAVQPAASPPPEDKSGRAAFEEKLKELNAVPDGKTYAVGDDTFVKRSGNWYLSQVEGVQGFDDKGLLALVNDGAKEDLSAKIEKDKKSGYNLGVTIRGDQFIGGGADKSATFNRDNTGLYKDLTFIPAEIVAQYWFEEVQGETDMGAIAATIIGETGVQTQAFIVDELAYVLDGSDLYIVWSGNQDNPLEATYNLLEKVDPNRRIGGTSRLAVKKLFEIETTKFTTTYDDPRAPNLPLQRSTSVSSNTTKVNKGLPVDPDIEKYATVLLSYRSYLNVNNPSQKPLGMRIDELRGLGELRDKIKQSRSLVGKFFDLFNADDIKMNFTITQWGPAFVRKQMFGTRGGSNVQGGLSPADVKAFEDTGLFREQTLRKMNESSEYIAKKGLRSSIIMPPNDDVSVKLDYVDPITGFDVEGVEKLIKREAFEAALENTFADAYFLYYPPGGTRKIIELKGAPPAPEQAAPAAPAPVPEDPWKGYNEEVKKALGGGDYAALGDGYYTFDFNRSDKYVPDPADYLASVIDALDNITDKIPKDANVNDSTAKFQIFVVGTADPVGEKDPNEALSQKRAVKFFDEFKARPLVVQKLDLLKYDDKDETKKLVKITSLPLGEEPWAARDDTWGKDKRKYTDKIRAPLRIAKVFIGPFNVEPTAAKGPISKLLMDKASAIESLKESVDLESIRRQIRRILLESMSK